MRNILITGGAGFIGINTAKYFLEKGEKVCIYDNLSRVGSELNIKWLKKNYKKISFIHADVRDFNALKKSIIGKDVIFHLAGQVAVTLSVDNPRNDFEINAGGSFNVLEAMRLKNPKAILLFPSTNKIYGGMESEKVVLKNNRYVYKNLGFGVNESYPLDFHSPYGCSKGASDQYIRDYARIYGLNTIILRQSCIYGPHQFGIEDQGWLAWFVIAAMLDKKITIYGDGKQVRDILFIDDLVRAFDIASKKKNLAGEIYNIGGGTRFSISVWREFGPILEDLLNKKIKVNYKNWRPGDQKIYISDIRKANKELGWYPKISPNEGIRRLVEWVNTNRDYISKVL